MLALDERRARIDVDRVVGDLRAIDQSTAWGRTMRIGQVVFEGIFRGNAAEWRAKRGNKSRSLRKLIRHPQCPFKRSTLSAAVNVYLFVQECPDARGLDNVTPSHVSLVCSMPMPQALELLTAANAGGWTIREIGERAQSARRSAGERRGRPRAASAERAQTMASRCLRSLEHMNALLDQTKGLDDGARARLVALLDCVSQASARLRSLPQLASGAELAATRIGAPPAAASPASQEGLLVSA